MTDTKAHATDTTDSAGQPQPAPSAYDSDVAPVIRSKIQPPPLRSTTLTRQRLIDRLHEATQSRVTLLVAEAGYGKTTLLADFAARSGQRTLWYRLDPTDADAITWTNYLIAACREIDPSFGSERLRLLTHVGASTVPRSAFLETLAAELAAWTAAPTMLILDDFHRVDRSAEVCEVVYRLIETAPPWMHVVISTRRRPPLDVARLAVAGELAEIGSDELRFSRVETSRLFAECYGRPLDDGLVRSIEERTRGWAASLALVFGSIRDKSSTAAMALAEGLSGATTPIYDFLAEEVMSAVPDDLESLLMRASILEFLSVDSVLALFARDRTPPTPSAVTASLDRAEGLGLLSRASRSSDQRELHPLLRDFLAMRLKTRVGDSEIRFLHLDVANELVSSEPLLACRHLIHAGERGRAMTVLEASILKTLGSGQWGLAADLVDRLRDTPPGPGVAAIRARQLMDDGDLVGAERMLEGVDAEAAGPLVRSALRQTQLALGWRTGNREAIRSAAQSLIIDHETPGSVREIAQLFDDGPVDEHGPPLIVLASRFIHMSQTQAANGLDFFSAVALHNASVAYLAAGDYGACLDAAQRSLSTFSRLPFHAAESLSTHSIAAVALMESGQEEEAERHVVTSMANGRELADVPALIAIAYISTGLGEDAVALVSRARALEKQGRVDVAGSEATQLASAFAMLADSPASAVNLLDTSDTTSMLDLGAALDRRVMLAHAQLAAGHLRSCAEVAGSGVDEAARRGGHRSALRLAVLAALASEDKHQVALAVREAAKGSRLALPELADVITHRLDLADECTDEVGAAISAHPGRWLPLLRQALGRGAPAGHQAAFLLDRYGESRDVGVLRAYSRTYRSRGASPRLGLALARRTSPRLRIHDLGRVILEVGERSVALSGMRRKPAALLLYLVSRSSFTAHRDQVIDDLWPDADPASALNSLNQSLYFLRREIDPWYEDGVTPDYVGFEGDLIWLDAELVTSDSAEFLTAAGSWRHDLASANPLDLLRSYSGHFAPEFEYEEWALAFRAKLRSTFLETASGSIAASFRRGEHEEARTAAVLALEVDEAASDIERTLVWLHWHLGAKSAAKAQFEHLQRVDQLDGLDQGPLVDLVGGPLPLGDE